MKYKVDDLDFIFVRVKAENKTLNEMTDKEFLDWSTRRFGIKIVDDKNAVGTPWTKEQKVALLNEMSKRAESPVVVMIDRKHRKDWKK